MATVWRSAVVRLAAVVGMAAVVMTGCGSDSGSGSKGAAGESCTAGRATEVAEILVTPSGYSVTCAKVNVGKQVYFVNHDDKQHSVIAADEALDMFDATLDARDSTYPHTFKKAGTYHVSCREHNEQLTIIVT